jgi:C-terminal processing protease CtpA/Prc
MKIHIIKIYCLHLLFIVIIFISCKSALPQNENDILSLSQVNEDFKALTDHIEKDVPHPYYSCPKETYDSVKRIVAATLKDSMSVSDVYRAFYPLVQVLNDAHFSIHLSHNYKDPVGTLYFPIEVIINNNQLFVDKNLSSNTAIKRGDEIISINDMPVKKIIEKIRSGDIKMENEENFFERWNEDVFSFRLNSLFGSRTKFSIQTKEQKIVDLVGISEEKFVELSKSSDSIYAFKIINDGIEKTGYIRIGSLIWDNDHSEQKNILDSFLQTSFKKIRKDSIQHLILDIRNNLGGSTVLARDVLDYVTDSPYTLGLGEDNFINGKITRVYDLTLYVPAKLDYKFSGKTILLTNVLTYSSAHMMAVGFKYYHLGITVGQMSSEPLFITGEVNTFSLPNSQCLFYYPISNFILPGFDVNRKSYFVPDYEVYPDLSDLLSGKDTLLNFALKLFKKKN